MLLHRLDDPRRGCFDRSIKSAQSSVSKVISIKGGLLMRILTSLVAGFLSSPPPKAVLVTLVWLGGRLQPVITLMTAIAILAAWKHPDD
jgi:hypothetical protein